MWNRIRMLLEKTDTIIVFGCTKLGADLLKTIEWIGIKADVYFYDNDCKKQGERFQEKEVLTIKKLKQYVKNSIFVLSSIRYYEQMKEQLIGLGVEENVIIVPEEILIKQIETKDNIIKKRIPKSELRIVIDLVEHCNLNCQSCDHFSPLAEETYLDLNSFENDIKRMSELMGEKISCVDLEGGEPLLNPQINVYMETVYKYLPKTQVRIFTNGILLKKMDHFFWDVCRKNKVIIMITKYPIDLNYSEIEEITKENHVEMHYYGGGVVIKKSMHKPLDIEGRQDRYNSFHACYMANGSCSVLKNGKFYGCTLTPNLKIFNNYFGKNLEVSDKDYIDIYENITSDDIFNFLCNPTPACRYCKVNEWTYENEWKTTQKRIEEWT